MDSCVNGVINVDHGSINMSYAESENAHLLCKSVNRFMPLPCCSFFEPNESTATEKEELNEYLLSCFQPKLWIKL